jgi:SAM-dependent methyltransferase
LGDHPLANGFLTSAQLKEPEATFPLDVYACLDCGLIQIADNVPLGFFRHYVYIPSASDVMKEHFVTFGGVIAERYLGDTGSLTIDIGCNDGLLLAELDRRGARTLGIDPATNIIEMARAKGIEVVNEYFSPDLARQVREAHGPAAVVVTTNTYHHVGDLDAFTEGVSILLDEDGLFVVEVPYAREIVETNQFDGVYHEHVSQFTIKSFVDHLRRFGLEVCEITHLDVHGGSVRVVARRTDEPNPEPEAAREWLAEEARRELFSAATYDAFRDRVEHIRDGLAALLGDLTASGHRIVGYGASARGNTLLNYCAIGSDTLEYIVDRNPLKHGLYTPGMHIPVHGVERLLQDMPSHVLVIAWNFAEEIMRQQAAYQSAGGTFILPIPEPHVAGGMVRT